MLTFRRRRALRFVFTPESAGSGTTVMRGRQLAEIVQRSGLTDHDIFFEPVDSNMRSSDLFVTKGAARSLSPEQVHRWRRRGNRVLLDPVDEDVTDAMADAADVVVAASASADAAFRERWPHSRIARIDHHVDPRLRAVLDSAGPRRGDDLVIRYFGESVNTIHTERIAAHVTFVQVDTSRQDPSWMSEVPSAGLHYAIRRRRALDRHKPFLKGFTAAAAGANVLIGREEAEAAHWLPADYPYWVEEGADEDTILEALRQARESFGGAEWREGLDAMRAVEERTTDEVVVRQLLNAVS